MAKDFSIDKPLELFNAYVQSITASASYGSDGSTCQLTLVAPEDADGKSLDGPGKTYKPDFPALGTAIGIKWEGFSFGGVLQRYTKKRDSSGYTWDVIIEAPAKVLDGVQVITEAFQGTAFTGSTPLQPWEEPVFNKQMNNIWNPFALRENYTYGGIFGGSDINSIGWPALDLLKMVQQISTGAGEQGTGLWAKEGRGEETGDINFDGITDTFDFGSPSTNAFGGKAVFGESEYLVNLNAIIDIPNYPEFFRIKGPVQSLNSILQEAVDIAVHDYIVGVHPCPLEKQKVARGFQSDWDGWYDRLLKNTRIIYSTSDGPQYSSIKGATRIGFPIEYSTMKRHKDDGTVDEVNTSSEGEPNVVEGSAAGGLDYAPMIKISVQDKTSQPIPGIVEEMVVEAEASDQLMSADSGKEYNDAVTQKLVIGGPASRYWKAKQEYQDLMPVWGRSQTGYPNYYLGDPRAVTKDAWQPATARATAMSPVQIVLNDGSIYEATILELRCSISEGFDGEREVWDFYHRVMAFWKQYNSVADIEPMIGHFPQMVLTQTNWPMLMADILGPGGMIDTRGMTANEINELVNGEGGLIEQRLAMIFERVRETANTMWGQQFLARLPVEPGGQPNNIKWVKEDQEYITSWDIASSAWTDDLPFSDVKFYDSEGRTRTTAVWEIDQGRQTYRDYTVSTVFGGPPIATAAGTSNLRLQTEPPRTDYSALGTDYAYGFGGIATTQAQVEQDILWIPRTVYDAEGKGNEVVTACVPVSCPPVRYHDDYTASDLGMINIIYLISGASVGKFKACTGFCGANYGYTLAPVNIAPEMFGIAQQSNRYNWGPWYQYSKLDGRAEVTFESNLKPETFGNFSKMNDAGWAYSFVGNAMLGGQESGYIELAEVPNYNLTDRFAGSGPYITSMDINVGVGGITTNYKFNTWTRSFGKLAKYNADRLARINKNTLKFLQEQRNAFQDRPIPPFGNRIGRRRLNAQRRRNSRPQGLFGNMNPAQKNPDSLWVNIQPMDLSDALGPLANNYTGSFGCSVEQLWSPIEIKGLEGDDQSAPGFRHSGQVGAQPPDVDGNIVVVKDSEGNFGSQHVGPTNSELNPYFTFGEPRANTDFEIVVHGQRADDLSMYKSAQRVSEVRTMGLRGPLLLSGWGYGLDDTPVPALGATGTDKFKFADDVSRFRTLWKTGPVDLKWDDERQVWSGGPQFLEGKLTSNLTKGKLNEPTTATMKVYRRGWDDTLGETITLRNRDNSLEQLATEFNADSGETTDLNVYVMAMRINYEWRPVWVGCPDAEDGETKTDSTDDTTPTGSSVGDTSGGSANDSAGYGAGDMWGF